MKLPFEFQPMVDKGCKLLDERLGPDWVEKIDLERLDLEYGCECVLGQLCIDITGQGKTYNLAAHALFPLKAGHSTLAGWADHDAAEEHGFILQDSRGYDALTACWKQTILSRRAES